MKGSGGMQKVLYLIMAVVGIYILYKAGSIFLEGRPVQEALDSGEGQRRLEDAAVRTWMPGYAAAVEEREPPNWMAQWMRQVVPVYSYLAEGQSRDTEEEQTPDAGQAAEPETDRTSDDVQTGKLSDAGRSAGAAPERFPEPETAQPAFSGSVISDELLRQLEDYDYLLNHYYTVDEGTMADSALLDADTLLRTDLRLEQDPSVPQILIYHTHSQEAFADSREGAEEDTIVGMGEVLAEELRNTYGYNVIHDTGVYDLVDGQLDRSAAYDYARDAVEKILEEHPTIEVIIDLHRDGVDGQKFVTEIDGRSTSKIMFFNGISRDSQDQPLTWLENPYVQENLAFSLQMQLAAEQEYPGLTRNIYLKAERFNLHLRPRSLLIEAGTQLNTVEEERNAMGPTAALLSRVLSGTKGE